MSKDNFQWTRKDVEELIWHQYGSPDVRKMVDEYEREHQPKIPTPKHEQERGWEVVAYNHYKTGGISNVGSLHKDDPVEIHSVKRLRDDTLITVGMESLSKGRITKLELPHPDGDNIYVHYDLGGWDYLHHVKLPSPQKSKPIEKEKLFTTEDGVDVYEGDNYWYVSKDGAFLSAWEIQRTNSNSKPKNVYGCFSSKEKAEEYCLMNKPCLSLKEIQYWLNRGHGYAAFDFTKLRELVKEKLSI